MGTTLIQKAVTLILSTVGMFYVFRSDIFNKKLQLLERFYIIRDTSID